MLSHLVYASRATRTDDALIGNILQTARRHNRAAHITGVLLYDGKFFLQLLEGDRSILSQLFQSIAADPRHTDVTLISAAPVAERVCHGWAMGYLGDEPAVADAIHRYSSTREFDPRTMGADSAIALLRFVATQGAGIETTNPA